MKVSCLPVAMFPLFLRGEMDIPCWASSGVTGGLDGVDISTHFFKNHSPAHLAPIIKSLKTIKTPIVMVVSYPDFTHPDPVQREREFAYLCSDIALSSELGARYVRVLAGQAHPHIRRSESVCNVLFNLKKADEFASRFGVTLVYENHSKPSAWQYTDFSHPSDIFLEIVAGLSETGIKVNFDTANVLAYGDDTMEILSKVIERVETVHVADTSTVGKLTPTKIGNGLAPIRDTFSLLKSRGFNGWLCIEDCVSTTIDGIADSANIVRSLWGLA